MYGMIVCKYSSQGQQSVIIISTVVFWRRMYFGKARAQGSNLVTEIDAQYSTGDFFARLIIIFS